MSRIFIVAVVVGLAGLVFTLQGIGVLPGSAMSGSAFWAIVGSLMIVVAVVVGLRALRSSHPA